VPHVKASCRAVAEPESGVLTAWSGAQRGVTQGAANSGSRQSAGSGPGTMLADYGEVPVRLRAFGGSRCLRPGSAIIDNSWDPYMQAATDTWRLALAPQRAAMGSPVEKAGRGQSSREHPPGSGFSRWVEVRDESGGLPAPAECGWTSQTRWSGGTSGESLSRPYRRPGKPNSQANPSKSSASLTSGWPKRCTCHP